MLTSKIPEVVPDVLPVKARTVSQAEVAKGLATRLESLEWAILALMGEQTRDEVEQATTAYQNGVGFNAGDAGFFTYVASYMTGKALPKLGDPIVRHLSGKHLDKARERIMKYQKQVTRLVNAELAARAQARAAKENCNV